MKATNAIKKLERAGLIVTVTRIHATGLRQRIQILTQGGEVATIRTIPANEQDDSQTDYFAGSFWPSLAQALRHAV